MSGIDVIAQSPSERRRPRASARPLLTVLALLALAATCVVVGPGQPVAAGTATGCPSGGRATALALPSGDTQTLCYPVTSVDPAGISLAKTVGTSKIGCAVTDTLAVASGTEVVYCYTATNTGGTTLTTHDLVDSRLGTLFTGLPYSLAPGASVSKTVAATIREKTVNAATWTAHAGATTVSSGDSAIVTLSDVPQAPSALAVTATGRTSASLSWTAPGASGVTPTTSYGVNVYEGSSPTPSQFVETPTAATTTTVNGLLAGHVYRFSVVAINSVGAGDPTATSAYVLPPFRTVNLFTDRQYRDFTNVAPTAAQLADARGDLVDGSTTAPEVIDPLVDAPYWARQDAVIRLFQAYFLRLPDLGGLNFWTGKYRTGTNLNTISSSFAGSSEFKTRYGSLSNQAFVERVYQNVLGRPGESSGVAFWTGQLNAHKKTRGQVMVGFSESNEYKVKTAEQVDVVDVFTGMLRRVPTGAENTLWVAALKDTSERTDLIASLLASAAYDTRIPA